MAIAFRYPDDPVRISQDRLKKLSDTRKPGSLLAQLKFDGWRCPMYKIDGRWQFYAKREGTTERDKPPPDHLVRQLDALGLPDGVAFDGEWMGPRDVYRVLTGKHYFVLFDMMYFDGQWQGDVPFSQRVANLKTLIGLHRGKAKGDTSLIEVAQTVDSNWNAMFEESKKNPLTEGIVLREADSWLIGDPRAAKDNALWMKVKWRDIKEPAKY